MRIGAYLTSQIRHQLRVENMYNNTNRKNKDFGNHNYNCILNSITLLFSELKKTEQNQSSQTKIYEVILECKITDIIQKILDICNPHLKNFKLRLEME